MKVMAYTFDDPTEVHGYAGEPPDGVICKVARGRPAAEGVGVYDGGRQ